MKLAEAIENFDVAFFQALPGVGPKTAKKILVELKSSFSEQDIIKVNADEALVKNIVKTLSQMGYEKTKVMRALAQYKGAIVQEELPIVLQWLIQQLQ